MDEKRLFSIDILRSILVVWIVFYWHLSNYILPEMVPSQYYLNNFTEGVLATFMFLSGLFTSSEIRMESKTAKLFYVKRFKRFYILYLLAAISLFFVDYPFSNGFFPQGLMQLLMTLLGCASLFNCAPSTLWFMDVLLFYIWITPLILASKNKYFFGICLYLLLFVVHRFFHIFDNRLVFYFLFYLLGLYLKLPILLKLFLKVKNSIIFVVLFIVMELIPINNLLLSYIQGLFVILGLLGLSNAIERKCKKAFFYHVVTTLSYSSMTLYFFHRQIYSFCHFLNINIVFWPLFVIFLSYTIQVSYDSILKKCKL